jgi:asparagine synthase (glutamine-hydrolysing)
MCGICGIFYFDPQHPVKVTELVRMATTLHHRGPDDEGYHVNDNLGLGHKRLSIIDLSPMGRQPMCNEDGRLWLVFNGEIYNYIELREMLEQAGHIFRSRTDTEVLLHLYEEYGPQCVHHLNGMFAFAIWDQHERQLFLARDPFGIKARY